MDGEVGSLASSGAAAILKLGRRLSVLPGISVVTGQPAALLRKLLAIAGVGQFEVAEKEAALLLGRVMPGEAGLLVLEGQNASRMYLLTCDDGLFSATGLEARLRSSALRNTGVTIVLYSATQPSIVFGASAPMILTEPMPPSIEFAVGEPPGPATGFGSSAPKLTYGYQMPKMKFTVEVA